MNPKSLFYTLIFLALFKNADAQNLVLSQSNANGIYQDGQKIRMVAFLKNKTADSITVKIHKNFSGVISHQTLPYTGDSLIVYSENAHKGTTMIFEVSTKTDTTTLGLIVDPESFKPGTKRPKDFDAYWDKQKARLRALPIHIKSEIIPVNQGYRCENIEINCVGPKPVRGYFAKPLNAKPGSLPIVLYLHAAGVSGSWCRAEPRIAMRFAKMGVGALSFDLNAHGMLNGQPLSYYKNLENGELKNYAVRGLENRDSVYFLNMYLRVLRTIDFLTTQPEWDGKRILLIGESQGGGQALAAAGLDNRVSAAVVTVPAMCDWGGTLVGRQGSYPNPFSTTNNRTKMLEAVPYYDVAHLLKGSKATIVAEIGLIDYSCPSSAVFAALNLSSGSKTILTAPYRAHHFTQVAFMEQWKATIAKQREDFISDYLK